jgi:hypothetical protein
MAYILETTCDEQIMRVVKLGTHACNMTSLVSHNRCKDCHVCKSSVVLVRLPVEQLALSRRVVPYGSEVFVTCVGFSEEQRRGWGKGR